MGFCERASHRSAAEVAMMLPSKGMRPCTALVTGGGSDPDRLQSPGSGQSCVLTFIRVSLQSSVDV